ncbi:hypothetical protein D3C80_846570 [compost metagenome]
MIQLWPDPFAERAYGGAQGIDSDDVVGLEHQSGIALDDVPAAHHPLDGQGRVLSLDGRDADAHGRPLGQHLMGPHHDARVGNGEGVFLAGDAQFQFQLAGSAFQVDAQQLRGNGADEHDQADGAEQVGDGIGNRHMAVELRLGRGIDRQLIDRTGGGAHDRRVGERTGTEPGGETGIEVEYRIHQQNRAQRGCAQHYAQHHQLQRTAVETAEELWPTLEADGVDEHHKKY